MNSNLFNRALGTLGHSAFERAECSRQTLAIQHDPLIRFDGRGRAGPQSSSQPCLAHQPGNIALAIDPFEGRLLASGGADGSLSVWDLESPSSIRTPLTTLSRGPLAHAFSVSHISFYPFDSGALITSSADKSLKLYATDPFSTVTTYPLPNHIHAHALSPIASHLLIAVAPDAPAVRLVDLKTSAATHTLHGHRGSVLSVAWSPKHEHILASAGSDGSVRLWDVRRSANLLRCLDKDNLPGSAPTHANSIAHHGGANGIAFTPCGRYIVTAGLDREVRVWDAETGTNTLVAFGPVLRNEGRMQRLPIILPEQVTRRGCLWALWPNPREVLVLDLLEGTVVKRIRAQMWRGLEDVIGGVAWREGAMEMYTSHKGGMIQGWRARGREDVDEEDEDAEAGHEERKRKRDVLDEVVRSLTERPVTFT
ncbi:MAG: hypothetical protein M1814_004571 [Vezdaea aestivalis]|nr:MAG: hypothetical protein M1814_004571 [Vezdaea aestivalis]